MYSLFCLSEKRRKVKNFTFALVSKNYFIRLCMTICHTNWWLELVAKNKFLLEHLLNSNLYSQANYKKHFLEKSDEWSSVFSLFASPCQKPFSANSYKTTTLQFSCVVRSFWVALLYELWFNKTTFDALSNDCTFLSAETAKKFKHEKFCFDFDL